MLVQGFLPEAADSFAQQTVYPAFSPTVGVFLAGSVIYGLWKVGAERQCTDMHADLMGYMGNKVKVLDEQSMIDILPDQCADILAVWTLQSRQEDGSP